MNVTFISTGLLILVGVYFSRGLWPRGRRNGLGPAWLGLAGLGKGVVGLAPENVHPTLHAPGGLGLILAHLGLVRLGCAEWRGRRWVRVLSLGLGGSGWLITVSARPQLKA